MRKTVFLAMSVMTGIALLLASCDNATVMMEEITVSPPNPFVGTWEHTDDSNVRFVFTETVATGYIAGGGFPNDIYWTGTYTFNDTRLTVLLDPVASAEDMITAWPDGLIYLYKFNDDLLQISVPSDPSNLDTPFVLDFSLRKVAVVN